MPPSTFRKEGRIETKPCEVVQFYQGKGISSKKIMDSGAQNFAYGNFKY